MPTGNLTDLLHAAARRTPQRLAITHEDECISYAELERRAGRVAHGLRAAAVGAGRHVAILAKSNAEFFAVWFGAQKAAAVLLPVNFRLSAAEIA